VRSFSAATCRLVKVSSVSEAIGEQESADREHDHAPSDQALQRLLL
jgi:hypothetical protein